MKKLLYCLVVMLMSFGLSGCFGAKKDVAKVSFLLRNASEITFLDLAPDYEKRLLSVTYKQDFVDEKLQDLSSEGQIGGEYFDKFETTVKFVRKNDGKYVSDINQNVSAKFAVVVVGNDKKSASFEAWDGAKEISDLRLFYDEVVGLLAQNAPV